MIERTTDGDAVVGQAAVQECGRAVGREAVGGTRQTKSSEAMVARRPGESVPMAVIGGSPTVAYAQGTPSAA
ncbi:MAG TPA: hypothetical protein VJO13_06620 [Ktedonobacterales bacterium]|nr:hypothetical protein [Ktedonobacterales bacterium]